MKRLIILLLCSLIVFSGCSKISNMVDIIINDKTSREDDESRQRISDEEDEEWRKQNAADDAALDAAEKEEENIDKLVAEEEINQEEKKQEETKQEETKVEVNDNNDLFHYITEDIGVPGLEAYGYYPHTPDGMNAPLKTITKESDFVEVYLAYSKTRKSLPSEADDGQVYTTEVILNVTMGFAGQNYEDYKSFLPSNEKYMIASEYKSNIDRSFADMAEGNKSQYLIADISESEINCWASYPWEELYPKGMVTGIYFSRDLGSYIYIELFSAEDLQYTDVVNTVISYYDELVLNRNWTLD